MICDNVLLSTRRFKMLIKNIEKIFLLEEIVINIVKGIYFPGTY